MEGRWKFLGWGDGVLKTQILDAKYETKLEFPREGGLQNKNLPLGEYGYLMELHNVSIP